MSLAHASSQTAPNDPWKSFKLAEDKSVREAVPPVLKYDDIAIIGNVVLDVFTLKKP